MTADSDLCHFKILPHPSTVESPIDYSHQDPPLIFLKQNLTNTDLNTKEKGSKTAEKCTAFWLLLRLF